MYEIIRVGVPIKSEGITQKFLNVLEEIKHNVDCIAVSTTNYDQSEFDLAPAGTSLLLKKLQVSDFNVSLKPNVINTIGFIWDVKDEFGETRNGNTIANYILNFLDEQYDKLKFKKVYMFTPGSPNYYDSITLVLKELRDISIVDTKSSIEYCIDEMKKVVGNISVDDRNYHTDFLEKYKNINNKNIDVNKLNVFSCLQGGYKINGNSIMKMFFDDMTKYFNEEDTFISVHIGENYNDVIVSDFRNAKINMVEIENYPHMLTFGITKRNNDDYSRTIS